VGQTQPSKVHALLEISAGHLNQSTNDMAGWRALREGDTLYLACVTKSIDPFRERLSATVSGASSDAGLFHSGGGAVSQVRVATVTECITHEKDGKGGHGNPVPVKGLKYHLVLDPSQYMLDKTSGELSIYDGMNVVIRRSRRDGQAHTLSILSGARGLVQQCSGSHAVASEVFPQWLVKALLGAPADPGGAADEDLR